MTEPNAPQLTYQVHTDPDPLQASPVEGDPSLANLTIIVSNPGGKVVECESISFSFLQGTSAKDFFSDATGIGSTTPAGWSIQADGSTFTAKPDTPAKGRVGGAGLAFQLLKIKVNEQPGTTEFTITEKTNAASAEKTFELAKFPPEFHLSEIGLQPIPPIAGGGSITLSWAGSADANYQIQYEDADENTVTISHVKDEPTQPLPAAGSYTIENLMKDPTVFYLIATVPVAGEDRPLTALRERAVSVELTEVEATSFTVTPNLIVAEPGSFPVVLNWATTAATKVLIDNHEVTGQSTTRTVTETTAFTLEADGYKGPKYLSAQVIVKEPPVEVTDFRANPPVVYGANNNIAVELTWETAHAELVLLNDNIVETQSANETINQTTTFTLKATGNEGPSIKQVTIPVEDPNLTVAQTGDGRISATFGANPAHYSVRFTYHYPPQNVVDPDTGEMQDYHVDKDVQGQGQVVTVVGDPIGSAKTVEVTVTGFAGGPITAWYTPPPPSSPFDPTGSPFTPVGSPFTPMG